MTKKWIVLFVLALVIMGASGACQAQGQRGRLEIMGVPADAATGRYNRESGVFAADVRDFAGAAIHVTFEEVRLVGQKMEWRTEDDYLIFTGGATLTKEDFTLTAETVEYFGSEKRLQAVGSVIVVTEDATVYAQQLDYDEETDRAVFTGQVKVEFEDGVLEGEKFVMFLETRELQFFGAFQGLFNTERE